MKRTVNRVQACAIQKMPVPAAIAGEMLSGKAIFDGNDAIAIKLAFIKPETSPPRA